MGKGQRHSKNAGVMGCEALSYSERRALGFGTVKERLGKDSIGNFDDCCLTLQAAVDPVVTPEGHLYSKEAILENLLAQKKAIRKRVVAFEAQQQAASDKTQHTAAVHEAAQLIAFDRQNHMGISETTATNLKKAIEHEDAVAQEPGGVKSVVAIRDNADRMEGLKAFWMPSCGPKGLAAVVPPPDLDTHCPASGKKLRMKELVQMKFTRVREGEEGKYMDPVTKDNFTNASKLVVLLPTGDVVLKETYEKCIKPDGKYNGTRVRPKDVVELKTSGTGFSARDGDKGQSSKHWTLGPGSGRQDLRGQHASARSLGGLVMNN
ncbi:MAG: hypothetical protein WDW36_002232 [Sanguina aurantia]